jgi:LacI family transcriptional regulator
MNLEDVARKAGVSRSTVSRVINNHPNVSPAARERVLAVINQVDFQPNHAARTLVTRQTNIIGVSIPEASNVFMGDNSYFPMLLQGISETLNRCNYTMMLWLGEDEESRDVFARRVVKHRQPDGLIITSIEQHDPLLSYLLHHRRVFVMVETPPHDNARLNYVTVDNVNGARLAVEHLIKTGRRRIATITGQINIYDAVERLEGYRLALESAGLPVDEQLILRGRFNYRAGYAGAQQLLAHKPDAIFTACDASALGCIRGIQDAGLRIPDDIAVAGFDDIAEASRSNPPLTTVSHQIQRVGSTAAQLLIDILEERLEQPQQIVIPTQLIIRASTVGVQQEV